MVNKRTGKAARRLTTIGLPLILFLALVVGWNVVADEPAPSTDGALALYEIRLADVGLERWEVQLPPGSEYVGLAAGSQVGVEPEISGEGDRLVWTGPFPDAQVLRFWLAPARAAEAPATLPILGIDLEALRVEPVTSSPGSRETSTANTEQAGTVTVSKTVEPDLIEPGDSLWVTYEVVFVHEDPGAVTLERITDTLPADFLFGGMAYGSDVITAPIDAGNSQYVWESVTFSGTLTMRYNVRAVNRGGVYQNSVVALVGGEQIGPASATLSVAGFQRLIVPMVFKDHRVPMPLWQITKVADPPEVDAGEPVNYSVEIRNIGDGVGIVGTIWDFVPAGFTFVEMLPGSEVTTPPSVLDGWLEWWSEDDPWEIAPGENLVLYYQMQSGGEGAKTNRVEVYTVGGRLVGTASATVNVLSGVPLPFEDDFVYGDSNWQPFLNFPGLVAGHWIWSGQVGVWGLYNYDYLVPSEYNGFHLSLFDEPGTENWTDYRVEIRLKDVKEDVGLQKGLTGVWFRGTYEDSGAMDGKTVGGYYFYIKPADDHLYLMRTPPANPTFASQVAVASYPWAPGIGRKHWYKAIIEVRGANIKVWFEDDEDGIANPSLVFNWTDPSPAWSSGTVGFSTYNTSSRFDYIRVLPLD
jgi:uncharacterized repeat protein (TIGR01451 family)